MKFYLKIYIYIPAKQPSSKSDAVRCVCILCCLKKEVEEKRGQQRYGERGGKIKKTQLSTPVDGAFLLSSALSLRGKEGGRERE